MLSAGGATATQPGHGVLEFRLADLRTLLRAAGLALECPRAERFAEDLVNEFERGRRATARSRVSFVWGQPERLSGQTNPARTRGAASLGQTPATQQ